MRAKYFPFVFGDLGKWLNVAIGYTEKVAGFVDDNFTAMSLSAIWTAVGLGRDGETLGELPKGAVMRSSW